MLSVAPPAEPSAADESELLRALMEHHRALEASCETLLAHAYSDDPRNLILHYRLFEHSMLEHLAAEDDLIIPAYAESVAADARLIADEHAAIRDLLFRIGVDVELHSVRVDAVKSLIEKLQVHAAHEAAGMYPWAHDHLPLATRRQLFVQIGRSLHGLLRPRPATAS